MSSKNLFLILGLLVSITAHADIAPPPPDSDPVQAKSTAPEPEPSQPGGCALIANANANIPPPPNDCEDKKEGDVCKHWDDRSGTCVNVCKNSKEPSCQNGDQQIVHLKCVAPEIKPSATTSSNSSKSNFQMNVNITAVGAVNK